MKVILGILIFIIVVIYSCGTYFVDLNQKTDYPEGRDLYISKCNSCHQLYSPDTYTATKWDSILVKMKRKAKLNEEQKELIYKWLTEKRNSSISQN